MLAGFVAHAQNDKIILGQSAPFTGPAAQLGIQFYQGATFRGQRPGRRGQAPDRDPQSRRRL
jgi:branched-chain amino acid transport system substrate-binding protein